jgi:uncharacterized protein
MKYILSLVFILIMCHLHPAFANEAAKSTMPLYQSLWIQFQMMLIDDTFWGTALGWLTACVLKVIIFKIRTGTFHFEQFFSTGGMPSSHSAFASCLTVGIGLSEGFSSAVFGLSMGLTILTAVDAVGLRKEAGLQAECINQMLAEIYKDRNVAPVKLRETLGHSLPEVLAGIFVGSTVAFLINFIIS